jgi:dTDP-glucose 4,6-dehydratase
MKHVLITGGAGFVGSHLCDLLLAKGYAVTAVDNLVTGRKGNITDALKSPHFDFVEWDVSLPMKESQCRLISKHGLHGVFHFACPASPIDFDRIPFDIMAVDSVGTMLTVDLALKYGARYLLASTSEIYGDPEVHPQNESYWGNVNTIGPRSCYDETKRFAEAYVSTAVRGVGKLRGQSYKPLNAGIVRIFNTYGPRMRADDGRVVPQLCVQALQGQPLTIHGDGKQTRSFCYVSDLVDGIVRLFESEHHDPVNIGNPAEYSMLDFAEAIRKITGAKSPAKHLPSRPDDPRRRCPDITRAKTLLSWSPKVNLEEGLRKSLEYFRTQL